MNGVWAFLALGLLLPWLVRLSAPRGWARPRAGQVLLLSACAATWITVGTYAARREGEIQGLAPFALVTILGMIVVEVCLLLRPRRLGSDAGGPADPDEAAEPAESPLSPEAEQLLSRALRLEETPVEQLMTPRERVLTAEARLTASEVLAVMLASGRTRMVVVEGSIDRILGIAHAKDLVPLVLEGRSAEPVRRHLRRLLRVPRRVSARRLLEEFRRNRVTIGAVADVRGRTLGVVTLRDVFQFIGAGRLGDEDERDVEEDGGDLLSGLRAGDDADAVPGDGVVRGGRAAPGVSDVGEVAT